MDHKNLDASLISIIEKKTQLSALSYDHKDYDKIEEELHDMEDQFMESYGDYMEEALDTVHEKHCPDNDVLLPIAYLAHNYKKLGTNPDGTPLYDVNAKEGVWVDVDKYPDKDTRLVLIPSPTRIVLVVDGKTKEVVWQVGKK
jgi:hypothetical protein